MKTLFAALLACSLAACAMEQIDASADEPVATDEQEVIGGATDPGDPCVLGLFIHAPGATSGSLCTCTIWAPHTCLTAAHCVDPRVIGVGQVTDFLAGTVAAATGITASSTAFDPIWNPANLFGGHDFGAVHSANPLPFPACARGAVNLTLPARVVGYGTNTHANTGAGTKRTVTTNIVAANGLLIQVGNSNQQSCHGDSGGPVFQVINGVNTAVAVTSFGQDQSPTSVCFGGGFHVRVDADTAFINANTF